MASQFIDLPLSGAGGGSGGDASAANQLSEISYLHSISDNVATAAKQDTANTLLSTVAQDRTSAVQPHAARLSDGTSFYKATTPSDNQPVVAKARHHDGSLIELRATENNALGVGNGMKKFRDGFVLAAPDLTVWDQSWTNQGGSTVSRGGDTAGSAYLKISMDPFTQGSEYVLTTKDTLKFPIRFMFGVSASQRILGQELEVSLVGCDDLGNIESDPAIADKVISGTVTIASNVATINFATAHGLKGGDRVVIKGCTERRLNVGPVVVTVTSLTQITVPCTLANGTYTAGGYVEWADPVYRSDNAVGLLFENTTVTNASFVVRRNGATFRSINGTISSTTGTQSNTSLFCDAWNSAARHEIYATKEEMLYVSRSTDALATAAGNGRWSQGIPDEEKIYKIRVRAKNLSNLTKPIARITAIAKTGTTTATVTTDVAHGLAVTDYVQIYGVRDQTNFPNLTAQTVVASIVSATQFTIVIGAAVTASSAGGIVSLVHGSTLQPGIVTMAAQSISRSGKVMTVVGSAAWSGLLPGETVNIHGCDATSMGLYDGVYKVLGSSSTNLYLESIGADFTTINCGGTVMKRTDYRVHFIASLEHTRLVAELSNQHGSGDHTKSLPVFMTSGTMTQGSAAAISTSTGLGGWYVHPAIVRIADVASAAITSTSTGSAISNSLGMGYQFIVDTTVVSGTTPTMDVEIQESFDAGTTFFPVYTFPRISAVTKLVSPILKTRGTHFRIVRTVAGTSPSLTNSVTRAVFPFHQTNYVLQVIDRTIVPNTLSSTTPWFFVENMNDFQFMATCSAQTTAATLALELSDDQSNVVTTATTITTAVGTVASTTLTNQHYKWARLKVTSAGTGITLTQVNLKAKEG